MKTSRIIITIFGILTASVTGASFLWHNAQSSQCVETRGAFDIGSGSTKILIAEVNVCKKKILKTLVDDSVKTDFKELLSKSGDNNLPLAAVDLGVSAINNLKQKAPPNIKVRKWLGVATAAFRDSKNGSDILSKVAEQTGINAKVITQQQEGEMGFWGALSTIEQSIDDLIVWDIGGGSQEITRYNSANGAMEVYHGKLASIGFKNEVLKVIGRSGTESPNPLGIKNLLKAREIARKSIGSVPEGILLKIKSSQLPVIGIGGVHFYSIKNQGNFNNTYGSKDLDSLINNRVDWTDEKFNSKFSDTELTNLILVSEYMKALEIKEVRPIKVNLANGAIFMDLKLDKK